MIRFLELGEVLELHRRLIVQTGGGPGLRDMAGLESALAQPRMSFDNRELYPGLVEKASALGFSLVSNHPFVDGNKRIGHLAMETFLVLNGWEIACPVAVQEQVILSLAAGEMEREAFTAWLAACVVETASDPTTI